MDENLSRRAQRAQELVLPPDGEALARLHRLIDSCGKAGVSDMHVHPGKKVRLLDRHQLVLGEGPDGFFTADDIAAWLAEGTNGSRDPLEPRGHVSVALATDNYRVRGTFRKSLAGVTATFRLIPFVIPTMEELGLPASIADLIHRDSGLVIFYGPTGSGKTTSIAAMNKAINTLYDKHIYMIEDPTEFVHEEIGASSIVQRQIGTHAPDYPTAIQDALRSKPNVIMVGELLDAATAKAALHAATTGHLVFTTAHAGSVPEGINGFIGQFPANEQPQIRTRLSQSLLAIMVQKLVPDVEGGLTAAREVMVNNINFAQLIQDDKTVMIKSQLSGDPLCFTLEDDLLKLTKESIIDPATALAAAKDPIEMATKLRSAGLYATLAAVA